MRLVSTTRGAGGGPEVAGELEGFGGVDFFMDFFRGFREFSHGQAVFLFGVVGGMDGDRAQGDHLRAANDADLLARSRTGQPRAKVLPRTRDRQRLHRSG